MNPQDRSLVELLTKEVPSGSDADLFEYEQCWAEIAQRVRAVARVSTSHTSLSPVAVEDVVQDMLLRLHQDSTFRENVVSARSPGAYLASVLRHAAIDRTRRERTRETHDAEIAFAIRQGHSESQLADLDTVLVQLDDAEMKLLHMRFWDEKKLSDIAAELELSVSGTAMRLFRLMAKLRKMLDLSA